MQICYEYAGHMGPAGLMFTGFKEMYDCGHGCPDADYSNLGYREDPMPASIVKADAQAEQLPKVDIWDSPAKAQQVHPTS